MRIPLILILSAALVGLGCNDTPDSASTCGDCGAADSGSEAGSADVGTDASLGDAVEPPLVEGAVRCPDDASLDFTLRVVTLSGRLDLDGRNAGATFRPEWAQRAQVEATDVFTGRRFTGAVDLDGNYSLDVFAATYDVVVRFDQTWCSGACAYVPLAMSFDVVEDTSLDEQVEIVLHTVVLSLDGDTEVPSNDERVGRGFLDYVDVETNRTIRRPLNTARPASGRSWIPKDRVYDLYWTTVQFRPQEPGEPAAALPVGSYLLGQVDTREDGGDRYVVNSIVLDVELWIGGEAMPDDGILDGNGRGRLTVNSVGGLSSLLLADIGETGAASSELRVFPGAHTAMFQPGQVDVQDVLESWDTLGACGLGTDPCQWTESGALVLDFTSLYGGDGPEAVDVSGSLEFVDETGAVVEMGEGCDTAQVVFLEAGTGDYAAIASAENGAFETAMVAGPKDVWVLSNWDSACFIGGSLVAENVQVGGGTIEVQATLLPFAATLLVNGEGMPDDTNLDGQEEGRGRLLFTPTGYEPGQSAEIAIAETGPAYWEGRILAGEYGVHLKTMKLVGRVGEQPLLQDVLPSTTRSLGDLSVSEPASVTYDLTVLQVSGSVTIDPENSELIVAPGDDTRGITHGVNLVSANDGSATYLPHDEDGLFEGLVYEDSYRIDYIVSAWADYNTRALAPLVLEGSETGLWRLECGE
ncbi:MAG: hypothetical protein ACJAYU_000619 [Bradymonadia bacterium]